MDLDVLVDAKGNTYGDFCRGRGCNNWGCACGADVPRARLTAANEQQTEAFFGALDALADQATLERVYNW